MERPRRDPHDPRWRTPPQLWDKLKPAARAMRAEPTLAEATLWTALRASKLGVKFRRQHALGQFIVDFYARDADLVVEVDGAVHKTQRAQDDARDAILRDMGLVVLRFSNDEVFTDLEWVLKALRGTIVGRATR